MTLLCVDEDTPRELAPSIARLRPAWDVVFAVDWAGGGIKDQVLLDSDIHQLMEVTLSLPCQPFYMQLPWLLLVYSYYSEFPRC